VQISVVVATLKKKTDSADEEQGSMCTAIGHGLARTKWVGQTASNRRPTSPTSGRGDTPKVKDVKIRLLNEQRFGQRENPCAPSGAARAKR